MAILTLSSIPLGAGEMAKTPALLEHQHFLLKYVIIVLIIGSDEPVDVHTTRLIAVR